MSWLPMKTVHSSQEAFLLDGSKASQTFDNAEKTGSGYGPAVL